MAFVHEMASSLQRSGFSNGGLQDPTTEQVSYSSRRVQVLAATQT
jgi:hypothetical protein